MIIGITGTLGSGKTTVAKLFPKFKIINVDKLYRALSKPHSKLQKEIQKHFGKEVINKDKSINRKKLKEIVFKDAKKLKLLNQITHPLILKETVKKIKEYQGKNMIIDAPLLIEANFHKLCDQIIVVKTKKEVQLRRLQKERNLSKKEIEQIIKSQWSFSKKKPYADFIIDNSSTLTNTKKQINAILKKI